MVGFANIISLILICFQDQAKAMNDEKHDVYPSPPPPYSEHDTTYTDVNILKEKLVDTLEIEEHTSVFKKLLPVLISVLLALILVICCFFKYFGLSPGAKQNEKVFSFVIPLENVTATNVLQMNDLLTAVPYSYVSHSNITPICMFGEDEVFNVNSGKDISKIEREVFCGVTPSIMSRISDSRPIDSLHMQCRCPASMSEYLTSNSISLVPRNARFMQKPKALKELTLTTSIFFNSDSLLYSEIEDLVENSGHTPVFSELYSLSKKIPSSIIERAKNLFFKSKAFHWDPTPTRVSNLSFKKEFLSNSTFPSLSKSGNFDTSILRFRYSMETESFFLSSFASTAYNSSLVRLSQPFLNDLGALFKDESAANSLKMKYGTHVFQSGSLGGYLDILIEVDLKSIRDPLLERYYENLKFCLEYQFSLLLTQLYLKSANAKSLRLQAISPAFFTEFSKKIPLFVHENPKCYPICRLFRSSDLLFPSNFKSMEIRSSHMEHWSYNKIKSCYDAPTLSSRKLFEIFEHWYSSSKVSPKIIKGQMIPLHDLLSIYVVPFQQQYYLWTLSHSPNLFPAYTSTEEFFSEFDDKLISQNLTFDTPIRETITSIEATISKLSSILKLSKSNLEVGNSFIEGSSFDRIKSLPELVARQQVSKDEIVKEQVAYEKAKVSVLDVFIKISKPNVNSSILSISASFQKSFSPKNLIDWSLYPNISEKPLSFTDVRKDIGFSNSSSSFIVSQQLEAFPTGFILDTVVSRTFAFEEDLENVRATLPIGFFPSKNNSIVGSVIKDMGKFLPLDVPTSPSWKNISDADAVALPVPSRSLVFSFAPIDLQLFDYFSKYDNYSKTEFLDSYPPIYLSDFSIRVGSLAKLFSLKRNSFESSQEARFSPFVSSVVCPSCISFDHLDAPSSYNSYQISRPQAAQGSRCFSLIVDLPEPSRILAIKCLKNTPNESNIFVHQKLDSNQQDGILLNVPYHCEVAYVNEHH